MITYPNLCTYCKETQNLFEWVYVLSRNSTVDVCPIPRPNFGFVTKFVV